MRKLNILILVSTLCVFSINGFSQAWQAATGNPSGSVNNFFIDSTEDALYAVNVSYANGINLYGIGKWNGLKWSTVGQSFGGALCIMRYNGELYYGGQFRFIPFNPLQANVARWDATDSLWVPLGTGIDPPAIGVYEWVSCMTVFNNDLYVAGRFTTIGGITVNNIARWNGTSWNTVGAGLGGAPGGSVVRMCVFQGSLYAIGSFSSSGNITLIGIARWDGTSWHGVGGFPNINGALATDSNYLYIGDGITPNVSLKRWDGSSWYSYPSINGEFRSICIRQNGDLFVSGTSNTSSYNVSKWTSSGWVSTALGFNSSINDMVEYHGQIFTGGYFSTVNSIAANGMARYGCTLNTSTTKTSCPALCDGTATALPANGNSPYVFEWSNGAASNTTITNLCTGNYTLTITDSSGCEEIKEFSISSKPNVSINVYGNNPSCYQSCDGSLHAYFSGGTPPYQVTWSNNLTSDSIVNLCPGSYFASVIDSVGCQDTSYSVSLTNPSEIQVVLIKNELTCDTCCDGEGVLFAEGGSPPYSFFWMNNGLTIDSTYLITNLCSGNYLGCIKDRNNCIKCDSVLIDFNQPSPLRTQNAWIQPNPIYNKGIITINDAISLEGLEISIYNSLGGLCMEEKNLSSHSIEINRKISRMVPIILI